MVHHIVIILPTLSLLLLRVEAVGCTLTILPINQFCTRFSSFFNSPLFSAATSVVHPCLRVYGCVFCSISLLLVYMCAHMPSSPRSIVGVPSGRGFRAFLSLHTTCVRS